TAGAFSLPPARADAGRCAAAASTGRVVPGAPASRMRSLQEPFEDRDNPIGRAAVPQRRAPGCPAVSQRLTVTGQNRVRSYPDQAVGPVCNRDGTLRVLPQGQTRNTKRRAL